jgi:hypothetical protein
MTLIAGVLFSTTAVAETVFATPEKNGCMLYTICNAEDTNGACAGASENYATLQGTIYHTAMVTYVQTGGADGWTITLYNVAQGTGYDGTQRTQLNTTVLSVTNGLSFSWMAPMGDVHADVATLTDDTVTLLIKSCPAAIGG